MFLTWKRRLIMCVHFGLTGETNQQPIRNYITLNQGNRNNRTTMWFVHLGSDCMDSARFWLDSVIQLLTNFLHRAWICIFCTFLVWQLLRRVPWCWPTAELNQLLTRLLKCLCCFSTTSTIIFFWLCHSTPLRKRQKVRVACCCHCSTNLSSVWFFHLTAATAPCLHNAHHTQRSGSYDRPTTFDLMQAPERRLVVVILAVRSVSLPGHGENLCDYDWLMVTVVADKNVVISSN